MRKGVLVSSFLMAVLALTLVGAFGVSPPYWIGHDMPAYAGMNADIPLNLQNGAGATEDVIAVMQVIEGNDIASLSKSEYTVKAGENINVLLNVKIPSDAAIGKTYGIKIDIKTKSPGQAGAVSMGVGMLVAFNAVVGEKPKEAEKPNNFFLYIGWIVVIIAIAVILWIVSRKKGKKK